MRPDMIVVYDSLASDTPRTWEWNFHSPGHMSARGDNKVYVRNGTAQACVERVMGPVADFKISEAYSVPPQGGAQEASTLRL